MGAAAAGRSAGGRTDGLLGARQQPIWPALLRRGDPVSGDHRGRGLIKFAAGPWRRRAIKLALPALVAWSLVFTIESRTLKGRSLFDIDRHDINTIAAAAPRNALVFVAGAYWTSYANLSWPNAPPLDT